MTSELDDFLSEHAAATASATPTNPVASPQTKKRKNSQEEEANKKPKTKVQENRAIYVTNLPLDTNEDEIEEIFKKYGIIDQGADGNKRIKMYTDEDGNFNGEALIVYFKKESVPLAIKLMDDWNFRPNHNVRVKEADFSYKRNKDSDQVASKLTRKDRKASERNRADLNRKLAEWSDNEEEVAEAFAPKKNKWAKIVIIKNAFTIQELKEDKEAILEISEDMYDKGKEHGHVTKVTIFDAEEDGVITVRFSEFESAESFCKATDGHNYAYRKLSATLAEDKPKFKKAKEEEEPDSE